MILFNKILPALVLPLGVSLLLIAWGVARRRRRFIWAGGIILLVSSNPYVGHSLMRWAEGWAERRVAADVAPADAIVVLSPGRRLVPGPAHASEANDANRFFAGIELFQAGKAPLLVFTGAQFESDPRQLLEGDVMAARARALGVPGERIAVSGVVVNTADEAREVGILLRGRQIAAPRVLLVTSAFHMRRARLLFELQGMSVDPFPVDFRTARTAGRLPLSMVPSTAALSQVQTALREFYGRAFYWLRAKVVGA